MASGEHDGARAANPPEVSIARLPSVGAAIFGRRDDTAWLDACWAEGANVASIVAFGGVGKSALVWDWLRRMQRHDWRGAERVYGWSFYSQGTTDRATSADEFISMALRWFGDPDPNAGSPWDKGERLAGLLTRQRVLLVLDGVEPLQWGPGPQEGSIKDPTLATLVRELGAQNHGLCVITSRLAVREAEEFAPEKCRRLDLGALSEEAGAELLRVRGVKGTEEDLREAVREYGGHSLALALLGSYLEEVGEGDVRRRHEIGPLMEDERLGGHARRVMAAYERLFGGGSAEVAILRMLGLFDRPADEGEIAALRVHPPIAGLTVALAEAREHKWNKAVTRLRRVGLLATAAGQQKGLDAHPLVREHFREQLRQEWPDAWREGHRRLYEYLKGKAKKLPETIEEMAPLYAAVVHGCLAGKTQEAELEVHRKRIRRGNEYFSIKKLGAFGSEVAVLSFFFDPPWERLRPGLSDVDGAVVQHQAGFVLRALGRLPEAAVLLRIALEKSIAHENCAEAAIVASNLSQLLRARGELADALAQARNSVDLADKGGGSTERIGNRTTLAAALHAMGLREAAAAQFEEAERMQKEFQPDYPLLYSLTGFWYCDLLLDRSEGADVCERAAQTLEWVNGRLGLLDVALNTLSLGRAHLLAVQRRDAGDLVQAVSHLNDAVDELRRYNSQDYLPFGLLARAALHTHTCTYGLARHDLDEAHRIAVRGGFRLHEADAHLGYAHLALAERDPAAALDHLATARKIIDETGYHRRDRELAELKAEAEKMAKTAPPPVAPPTQVPSPPPPAPTPIKPMPDQPAAPQPVDLGIVVALQEEFRELLALSGSYTTHKDDVLTSYRFERGPHRIVVALVGDMGEVQATRVTERLITLWEPAGIVVVGIAAGVHDDLRVGDVYVPPQAVQYLQDAKASPKKDDPAEYTFVPGAPAYRADHALLEAVRHLEFGHPEVYGRWRAGCVDDFATLLPDAKARERLFRADLVRREVQLLADGHVATGPVVGAAPAFSAWIRTHDRNVKALEMESAAVLLAAQTRGTPTRAFAIRGISDYGDDRKKDLDAIGKGALRQYAMRNAVRLLWALLDAEALPHHPR